MHAPIRPLQSKWPPVIERRLTRFFWPDPRVIARDDVTPEQFRAVMSALHVGSTIKITGRDRHPRADQLIVKHVPAADLSVLDIGVSDGSTALDLVQRLPDFARYVLADRFVDMTITRVGRHDLFLGPDGDIALIAGPRVLAWPAESRLVRFVYARVLRRARSGADARQRVTLINPEVRELMCRDPRVTFRVHDIFHAWSGDTPTVIKVANVLRRLYFSDEQILQALRVLLGNLADGGYLLMVDNPRIDGITERFGLYRRKDGRFVVVEESDERPEIGELVLQVAADRPSAAER